MKRIIIIFLSFILLIGIYFIFLKPTKEIKIGFVGGLSGKYSYLGHNVLNGIKLALDEVNYKVKDYQIKFLQEDDAQNPELAKTVINKYLSQGVKLIMGNTTSSMTKESLKVIKNTDTILLSPSASTNELSNKDDNFLRTQVAQNENTFKTLSKYLVKSNIKKICLLYDPKNKAYATNYLNGFQNAFIKAGGEKFFDILEISDDFNLLIDSINKDYIDAIMLVANSFDSAKLIQLLHLKNFDKQIISSGWAYSREFLEDGGSSVDGVIFTSSYDENSSSKKYLSFVKKYKDKFNAFPSIYSAQAYESMKIVLNVLKKDTNIKNVKKNILNEKTFEGLQGEISFDKYGDVSRDYFLIKVKENKFVRFDK